MRYFMLTLLFCGLCRAADLTITLSQDGKTATVTLTVDTTTARGEAEEAVMSGAADAKVNLVYARKVLDTAIARLRKEVLACDAAIMPPPPVRVAAPVVNVDAATAAKASVEAAKAAKAAPRQAGKTGTP